MNFTQYMKSPLSGKLGEMNKRTLTSLDDWAMREIDELVEYRAKIDQAIKKLEAEK